MISVKTGAFMERTNNVLKDFWGLQTKLKIHDGKMLQWVYRIGLAGWVVSEFKRLCFMMDISSSLIIDAHADSVLNLTREPKLQGHLARNTLWEVRCTDCGNVACHSYNSYSSFFFILSYLVLYRERARFGGSEAYTYLGPY